jgi:signal transduction histidine kinase
VKNNIVITTLNFIKKSVSSKLYITITVGVFVLFWALYFSIGTNALQKKYTNILAERIDEVIFLAKTDINKIITQRPVFSSLALDLPAAAQKILDRWMSHQKYVLAMVLLDKEQNFFTMGTGNNDISLKNRLLFQDRQWSRDKYQVLSEKEKTYYKYDANEKGRLLLKQEIYNRGIKIADLIFIYDTNEVITNLKAQQRIPDSFQVGLSEIGGSSCNVELKSISGICLQSSAGIHFIISNIKKDVLLIVLTILAGIIFGVVIHNVLLNKTKLNLVSSISSQVAHDIRSPLAALNVILKELSILPEETRVLIRGAVQRIDDIANDLAAKNIKKASDGKKRKDEKEAFSVQLLSGLIDVLISEKRTQYRARRDINIESKLGRDSYGLFANVQHAELKRVLSNIVNNAVEAMDAAGDVILKFRCSLDNNIEIKIKDNGKGIPADVLPKLTQKGETFGKKEGSGLGLYHAKKCIESWGGKLNIDSIIGKGTTVTIILPRAMAPDWFVPEIVISKNQRVVVLDDDNSIHQVWQGRLLSAGVSKDKIIHIMSPEDMKIWYKQRNIEENYFYLCDYEYLGSNYNGLEIIAELDISKNALLVTSRFEEDLVMRGCAKLRVKLLPKNLAGFVPIRIDSNDVTQQEANTIIQKDCSPVFDYVLIDDDPLVHSTWASACYLNGKKMKAFQSIDAFYREIDQINTNIPLYIDSNLGENIKGEIEAKKIKKRGFKRIYLATGNNPEDYENMPWITGIVDKIPPFMKN